MIKVKNEVEQCCIRDVGTWDLDILLDVWAIQQALFHSFPTVNLENVKDLWLSNGEWNSDLIHSYFPPNISQEICQKIPRTNGKDNFHPILLR